MSLGIAEFLLHLFIQAFALGAAFGLIPPCKEMPENRMRRRLLAMAAIVVAIGTIGLKWPVGFFAAWDVIFTTVAVVRLSLRLLRRKFSVGSGCAAVLLGVGVSCYTIVFPAYKRWYDTLYENQPRCRPHLKELAIAMHNYAEMNDRTFPDSVSGEPGKPGHSWRVTMMPFVYAPGSLASFSPEATWDAPENLALGRTHFRVLWCSENPFRTDESGRYFSAFAAVTGPQTIFPDQKGIRFADFTDGISHTILIGECSGLNIVWTEPRDIDVSKQKIGINLPGDRPRYSSSILSSYHRGGAHVVFADGHVRFVSEKIDPKVLQALTTATGAEQIPEDSSW
jgi:prepilin-type processing-associated H-X9-DG protein